jgi:hypothetical protein
MLLAQSSTIQSDPLEELISMLATGQIPLQFGLPVPLPRRWSNLLSITKSDSHRLDDIRKDPATLLQSVFSKLRMYNYTHISATRRIKETELLSEAIWPVVQSSIKEFVTARQETLETHTQSNQLDLLERLICNLVIAYQLVLAEDYSHYPKLKGAYQERVVLSAVRILEWIRIQQRLCALRYRPLSSSAWQTVNTVFFVLLQLRSIKNAVEGLGSRTGSASVHTDNFVTGEKLFLSIQGFALFDVFSWPKSQQSFIDVYCAGVNDPFVLKTVSEMTSFDADCRFVEMYHDGPALLKFDYSYANKFAVMIDFSNLATAIRADQKIAFHSQERIAHYTLQRLSSLPVNYRRPLLRLMVRDMDQDYLLDAPVVTGRHEQSERWHLKTGWIDIRDHLMRLFSREERIKQKIRSHRLKLSGSYGSSLSRSWSVVDQTSRGLRIKTSDVRDKHAFSIGVLVLYGQGSKGMMQPMLGKVARVLRTQSGVIIVDLITLGQFATVVHLYSCASNDDEDRLNRQSGMQGLLVHDVDFGWAVLTPIQDRFLEGDSVRICTKRSSFMSRLRSLRDVTSNFLLFQIDVQDLPSGVPYYPYRRKILQ